MGKDKLKTSIFVVFEVVIFIAVLLVLIPAKWPRTGRVALALSFSNEEQQNQKAPYIQISGKSGKGSQFGPKVLSFEEEILLEELSGIWELTIEALDEKGTVIAFSEPITLRIRRGNTQTLPIVLNPVWTGSLSIKASWPAELGRFTKASLSCASRIVTATPILHKHQYEANFIDQGLPVGAYTFNLNLTNEHGGILTVPNIASFSVSSKSRMFETAIDVSDFGILPLQTEPRIISAVALTLEGGKTQYLRLSSPTEGAMFQYRYATDSSPMPEEWMQGDLLEVPPLTTSLEVEAQAVRGEILSEATRESYLARPTPVLSKQPGEYHHPLFLALEGDGVMVSTDGGPFSPYEGPLSLQQDGTEIRAYAAKEGMLNSPMVQAIYRFVVAEPIITYQDQLLSMDCPTEGATIHYTTDGSLPTRESKVYTQPLAVPNTTIFHARAFLEPMQDSPIVTLPITIQQQAPPAILLQEGTIGFVSDDEQASVWYRYAFGDDAFSPYQEGTALAVGKGRSVRVEAYCEGEGSLPSPVAHAEFHVAKALVLFPGEGVFDQPVSVPFGEGLTYFISLDGDPYKPYTAEDTLLIEKNTLLQAYIHQEGLIDSLPVTQKVRVRTAPPVFTSTDDEEGKKLVSIGSDTEGATIICSVKGQSFPYTGQLTVAEDTLIEAYAKKDGWENSYGRSLWVTVERTPDPLITLTGGERQDLLLSCSNPEATIWYRIAGDETFMDGNRIPVTPGEPIALEAYAQAEGKQPSSTISAHFPVAGSPEFSLASGFYNQPSSLEIGGSGIRYSINDEPFKAYDGSSLLLSSFSRLEAFSHQEGFINSPIVSSSSLKPCFPETGTVPPKGPRSTTPPTGACPQGRARCIHSHWLFPTPPFSMPGLSSSPCRTPPVTLPITMQSCSRKEPLVLFQMMSRRLSGTATLSVMAFPPTRKGQHSSLHLHR